jgi:hypothetical protein
MTCNRRRFGWAVPLLLLMLAGLASVATSRRPAPTHAPVYMSWKAFRQSARVVPPRAIKKRGKIYSWGKYLFLSEPNQGVHVFDNTHPQAPVAKAFIEAPGTIDIAGRGRFLYIDSFVDLLVFELTKAPFALVLVRRMKDVFPYNYRQNLPERKPRGRHIWPGHPDKRKGVVVGWKPLRRRKP